METRHRFRKPSLPTVLLWVVGGVAAALIWHGFQTSDLSGQRLGPLPQDPLIQVYMNHNPVNAYREPYRPQTRPGDNLEQLIADRIGQARSSIDVAVQELRSPLIAQALRDRHRAGVRVRLIIENTYNRPWSSVTPAAAQQLDPRLQDRYRENIRLIDRNGDGQLSADEVANNDALVVIQRAGIPWLDDTADRSAGSGLMHHKFVILDGQETIITSANFTMSDFHGDFSPKASLGNANSLVRIQSPAIAQLFAEEFNVMWGDGPGGKSDSRFGVQKPFRPAETVQVGEARVRVKFSPTPAAVPWEFSSNGLIGQTLSLARKSIDLALFVFSDQTIGDRLETAHQKGAAIRVLIEPTFAFQYYSEALDLLGITLPTRSQADHPCQTEAQNHPWSQPIQTVGSPQLPPGDLLHHKFGVVDRRTVIMGSHNWTEAADHNNDETLLVIESPTVAAHYEREYDRLWSNSRLGLPDRIRETVQTGQAHCPTITAAASPSSGTVEPSPSATVSPMPTKLNLNTATQADLELLPGVGPTLARRIIEARQKQPFRSLADLDQVSGVGPKLLQELGDRVTW